MDAEWLKMQFEINPGKSKSALADALGLDSPAISKILSGTRQIKAKEYAAMRAYFGLPVYDQDDFKAGTKSLGQRPLTQLALGERETPRKPGAQDWILPPSLRPNGVRGQLPGLVRVFMVPDDLMAPHFRHGETVLIDLDDQNIDRAGVFLITDGFGAMIRHCSRLPGQGGRVKVVASSPEFQPTVLETGDFDIAGRVAGKVAWVE